MLARQGEADADMQAVNSWLNRSGLMSGTDAMTLAVVRAACGPIAVVLGCVGLVTTEDAPAHRRDSLGLIKRAMSTPLS